MRLQKNTKKVHANKRRAAKEERLSDHFYLAATVFVWTMVLGVIIAGTVLIVTSFLHDKPRFDHLTVSGILYVAGIFTPRIIKVLDNDE